MLRPRTALPPACSAMPGWAAAVGPGPRRRLRPEVTPSRTRRALLGATIVVLAGVLGLAAASCAGAEAAALPRRSPAAAAAAAALGLGTLTTQPCPVFARGGERSRTEGYEVQRAPSDWRLALTRGEYYVLREGGTEQPGTSVLLKEKRKGVFKCAGCGNDLFSSAEKFDSGTGWPSFASRLPGVEEEAVNPLLLTVLGAELRCSRCGGHLGDVFTDGMLFQGTRAAATGRRYCIDGAALVFYPEDGGPPLRGEGPPLPPPKLPDWLLPPQPRVVPS